MSDKRELLRHALATIAYRGAKALRGFDGDAVVTRVGEGGRTPLEILAHLGDLFDWALTIARGEPQYVENVPADWDDEVARFFGSLGALDAYLASDATLHATEEKLLQGPVADALTHVGQIAMLRRIAGQPVRGESYFRATIVAGTVGPDQPAPAFEF
jgi:hypothetical protein